VPLFLKWVDCILELHAASLTLDMVELTERAVKLNESSDNVTFLSRYIPKSIHHLVDAIGGDKLSKVMSPVITQMKCKFVSESHVGTYMKPGGDALKLFVTEVTKRKKKMLPKKHRYVHEILIEEAVRGRDDEFLVQTALVPPPPPAQHVRPLVLHEVDHVPLGQFTAEEDIFRAMELRAADRRQEDPF
jgi:hypothetical protein